MPYEQLPLIAECELPALATDAEAEEITTCECPECGAEVERNGMYDVNGEDYCGECVYHCEGCSESFVGSDELVSAHTQSDRRNGPTELLCSKCRWTCADCSREFSNDADKASNASGDDICYRCEESYTACEQCNETIHNDDACYDEANECTLCPSCFRDVEREEEDSTPEHVRDHAHKPAPIFLKTPAQQCDGRRDRSRMWFGWEQETDSASGIDLNEAIEIAGLHKKSELYLKEDSSLDHGFEIVSHPGTWEYWQAFDFGYCDKLRDAGMRAFNTSTCGMHVHVSKASLTKLDRFKLLAFFRENEALIVTLSRRQRECLDRWAKVDESPTKQLCRKARGLSDDDKYGAINFLPANTVEFRLFRGTLNVASFKRNLALVVALCHFVKDASLGEMTGVAFLAWMRTTGRRIVGKPEAKDLLAWIESAVKGTVADDSAA